MNKGFRWSILWAIALIVFAIAMPTGPWTIDDSVKRIAAEQAERFPPLVVVDGPVRSGLQDHGDFAPLAEPFARRVNGGFALGFSPLTRLLFELWYFGGEWLAKLFPLLIGLILWWVLARSGIEYGFLLLPLTFYSLVPWEHALAWLLSWGACWIILLRSEESKRESYLLAGIGLAFAAALRPETLLLAGGFVIYLFARKKTAAAAALTASFGLVTIAFVSLFKMAADSAAVQISLNYSSLSFPTIIRSFPGKFYDLILSFSGNWMETLLHLLLLLIAAALILLAQRKKNQQLLFVGAALLAVSFLLFTFRLWSNALPPLYLLHSGSMLVALPWMLLLLLPPYRNRPAFWLGVTIMIIAILLAPLSQGVHWGPRLLLFAVPLFIIDLYRSDRAKGWLFNALLILTLAHTAGSGLLAYARASESSDHIRYVEPKLGGIVVCSTRSQCLNLAPLWNEREFFVASTPRELRQLLIEFRSIEVDTIWLHLDVFDPLYIKVFPDENPVVWPYRMTIVQSGKLYTTRWRLYELIMNRKDPRWGEILDTEAGYLMGEKRWEKAAELETEAVALLPGSAAIHSNCATALSALNQNDEAIVQARMALELDPELEEPALLLRHLRATQKSDSATPELLHNPDSIQARDPAP